MPSNLVGAEELALKELAGELEARLVALFPADARVSPELPRRGVAIAARALHRDRCGAMAEGRGELRFVPDAKVGIDRRGRPGGEAGVVAHGGFAGAAGRHDDVQAGSEGEEETVEEGRAGDVE